MSEYEEVYFIRLDEDALNMARFAACDVQFNDDMPPGSMEYATAIADAAIKQYIISCHLEQA